MPRTLAAITLLAVLLSMGAFETRAAQDDAPPSGGLGLTREEWEAVHGAGEEIEGPAIPFDALHAYENGAYLVAFSGSDEVESAVVMDIELVWAEPVPWESAVQDAERLLPADAEPAGTFAAPPTPGDPTALAVQRYESDWLSGVSYGTGQLLPDILVVYHQQVSDRATPPANQPLVETTVARASLMVRIPEG